MNKIKNINSFFNEVRLSAGAVWLENETLNVSVPEKFQNQITKDFITANKSRISSVLSENHIFSKEKFLSIKIFKDRFTTSYPLSPAQERLWFIEQFEEGTNAYHIPAVFELDSKLDVQGLKYAIQKVISRHEVLRSTIVKDDYDEHLQMVHEEPLCIEEVQLTDTDNYETLIKQDIDLPFDLSVQYPVRIKLYKIVSGKSQNNDPSERTIILINTHHIASDGWSIGIFQRELFAYYEAYLNNDTAFNLPVLEIQYKDYALWQRSYLTGEVLDKQLSYWKDKLSGYTSLQFPTDYKRPKQTDYKGNQVEFSLSKDTSYQLRELALRYGVTLHSVLLSSIYILLSKYTGQEDIVIGSPIANRHHWQTEDLIGLFINTQANRKLLGKSQSYEDLIRQVHIEQTAAQLYQDLPFEKLVDELEVERDTSRHPVFQVMFSMHNFDSEAGNKQKKYFKPFKGATAYDVAKFDLSIAVDDSMDEMFGFINYATSLFHKETITRLVGHYKHLLVQLVEAPRKAYSGFSLLCPEEYYQIVYGWNATDKEFSRDKTISQLFQEQAENTPNNVALVFEGKELTYKELNEKSNQLARHIRNQYHKKTNLGLRPDTLIALFIDRSLELVIGILGILKAGGAYVPIDPSYPLERINFLLRDTKTTLILTQRHFGESSEAQLPVNNLVYIDLSEELYQKEDVSNLPLYNSSCDLAYVIYTSGTTGKPKGVMLEHKGICSKSNFYKDYYSIDASQVSLFYRSYGFDGAIEEYLIPLLHGAKSIIYPPGVLDLFLLLDAIKDNYVTKVNMPPQLLYKLLEIDNTFLNNIKVLISGGDKLDLSLLEKYNFRIALYNSYGPTEATIDTHIFKVDFHNKSLNLHQSCIGKSVFDCKSYVLDSNQNPVPVGVIGELHVGGAGLSRGYLNNEALTSERFIANRFATESDKAKGYTRLYRTGDLVRWQPGGELEYIGRNDEQVKIRGYRIELGEIEHALSGISGIKQSCVLARERKTDTGSSKYLVGYYVLDGSGSALSEEVIREKLGEVLPDYMVPGALVAMEWFPLTINGKLDKAAFPDPGFSSKEKEYVAPVTETERALCRIWEEVLGLERVGTRDNFFRIGGDSILSIQVSGRMRKAGFNCQVKDIFTFKTIVKLSEHLGKTGAEMDIKSEQGLLTGGFGLLPIQEWFKERVESGGFAVPNHWNQSFLVKVPALDTLKLCSIVEELVNYHDVLRLRYTRGERWEQVYQRSIAIPSFKQLDVRQHSAAELRDILTQWQSGFDLEVGPLFQAGYLYGYEDGSARIFFAMHHMIADGVSWRILTEDIKTLYEGKSLPAKGSSYRQWVECVRQYGEQHQAEGLYWKDQLSGMPGYRGPKVDAGVSISFVELSKELTSELLQKSSGAYHTEINDLLITGLAYALKDINGSDVHGITLEGHGREGIDPLIDHSHTVGWYTSMFPVKVVLANTLKESIRSIKEGLRKIPARGIGFGAFAVKRDSAYTHKDLPPVSFNYLGQFDMGHGEWEIVGEDSGVSMDRSNEDDNLININGMVSHGELRFSIATRLGQDIGRQLGDSFKTHLASIVGHCSKKLAEEGSSYTPSDFKSVGVSQLLLDRLQFGKNSHEE